MKVAVIVAMLAAVLFGSAAAQNELMGAGATFPQHLYSKMFDEYNKLTGVKVNYQGVGSGAGIKQIIAKTVDFGGTDAVLSEKEKKEAGAELIHIPTCLGAVAVTYNLPGNPQLKFSPDVIADIFLGKITKWSDKRIADLNKGVKLPDIAITVVHRSDGSGTTYIFSEYLSKVSAEWKNNVGTNKALSWPVGLGGKGNPGVAGLVKDTNGSIGYVEVIYAMSNDLPVAEIKNKSGNFIKPSLESMSLSAAVAIPDDTCVSLTDTDAKMGYPISSFTWIILYKEQNYGSRTFARAEANLKLLWWVITDGQKYNEGLKFGKLSPAAVEKAKKLLKSVTFDGKTILK